jgi:hypothetical protein
MNSDEVAKDVVDAVLKVHGALGAGLSRQHKSMD